MRCVLDKVLTRRSIGVVLFLCAVVPALFPTTLTIAGGTTPENIVAAIDGDLSTYSRYDVGFNIDPVLRKLVYGGATFNMWLFRFGIGAFFSAFNEGGVKYAPGFSGSVGIEAPGVISVYVEYGLNPFPHLSSDSEVHADYGKLEAAIWLPHIRPRFIMQRKSLTVEPAGNYFLDDSLVRYQVLLDIFFKTSPFLITLGAGTETLHKISKPLPTAAPSVRRKETETASTFASLEVSWNIYPAWTLFLNVEAPLSSQGETALFKAAVGLKIALSDFFE
jgi:hypothetical protein